MTQPSSHHRSSTWSGGGLNHHLCAADFDALWADLAPGNTLPYWTSQSLVADCEDGLVKPTPEQSRARSVRSWAQRKASGAEGFLTQARRPDGAFDYHITRTRGREGRP